RNSFRCDYPFQLLTVFPGEESQRDQDRGVSEFVFNDVLGLLFPCLLATNIQDVVHYLEGKSCVPPVSAQSIYDAGFSVSGISAYLARRFEERTGLLSYHAQIPLETWIGVSF